MGVGVVLFHCTLPIVVEGHRTNLGTPLAYVHWNIHRGKTTHILLSGVGIQIYVLHGGIARVI